MTFSRDSGRLYLLLAVLSAGVLFYSQQTTLDWDEGFHLVAASLVAAGKQPYVDFCFPQPSLHAYWNALWLYLTGGGWRGPHAVAAVLTCGAIVMTAEFVFRRFRVNGWQLCAGSIAAVLVGLNAIVVEFGTKAQAYGAGTCLTVAAFRFAVAKPTALKSLAAGAFAGAAAACTLLTAPGYIVLFFWTVWQRKWLNAAAFVAGAVVPALPVLISLVRWPYLTWFNLVQYHTAYRFIGWGGAGEHDVRVLMSWVDSGYSLLLGVFAVAGLLFIRKIDWSPAERAPFYLAACMAAALGAEAAIAHPTFAQYFIFVVPFLAMPAVVGVCEIATRLSVRPLWAGTPLAALLLLSLLNALTATREDNNNWDDMDWLAKKTAEVTPAGEVLADPAVYFVMHRLPPVGMNFPASHRLELTTAMAATLHIVPQSQLEKQVRDGDYATVETCRGDEDEIQSLELPKLYGQSVTHAGCQIYWSFKRSPIKPSPANPHRSYPTAASRPTPLK